MICCSCRPTGLFLAQNHKLLLAARAIENQAYTVGANRTGTDKFGEYPTGISSVFDYLGEEIRETRRNGDIYALLDLDALKESRKRFPFYQAADRFSVELPTSAI